MVQVMVVSASPEGEEVVQAPRKLVAAVRINGLEQTENDPDVHGQNVQVTSQGAPEDRAAHCAETKSHHFDWRCVFSSKTEGRGVLVMDLVDVFIERPPVECAVREVVPGILEHKEDGDLVGHGPDRWEWDTGLETEELSHGVEEPVTY